MGSSLPWPAIVRNTMTRPISSQILPAVIFGGLPFYIGAIFWFFPDLMSKIFRATGFLWPELAERLYSKKAMKIMGVIWWVFGGVMWTTILLG